jgi:hypothetical protein
MVAAGTDPEERVHARLADGPGGLVIEGARTRKRRRREPVATVVVAGGMSGWWRLWAIRDAALGIVIWK